MNFVWLLQATGRKEALLFYVFFQTSYAKVFLIYGVNVVVFVSQMYLELYCSVTPLNYGNLL